MIAACALVELGATSPDVAFEAIAKASGVDVPDTPEQRDRVRAFADRLRSEGAAL
jgi:hypothetical protein